MPSISPSNSYKLNALKLIQQVLGEMGLPQIGSLTTTDETAQQMVRLLNGLGAQLARLPLWPDLREEWIFTTVANQTSYPLPDDWGVPLNGTQWDRTGRWPLVGPQTPSEWQYLKSGFGVAAPRYRYRYFNRSMEMFPAPPAGLQIVQEYLSLGWALQANGVDPATVRVPVVDEDGDYSLLDDRLMVEGTKLMFLEVKGLESSKQQKRFEAMLEAAWGNANSAPTLSLSAGTEGWLLSEWNAPDGRYGQ